MTDDWETVREELAAETDERLRALRERWDGGERVEGAAMGPRGHEPDEPPGSVEEQHATVGGIVSTVVFYTDERRETVLVYNPAGAWEPPGGVIEAGQTPEAAAKMEVREETGLDVALTDLLYSGPIEHRYTSGASAPVPLAVFAGHRVGGTLSVEREGRSHPGTARAVGLFDREVLPEVRRDRERILELLSEPPPWSPGEE